MQLNGPIADEQSLRQRTGRRLSGRAAGAAGLDTSQRRHYSGPGADRTGPRWGEAYAAGQAAADRAALAEAGRDLRYWTARRGSARLVPAPSDCSEVRFGNLVTIRRDDGREQSFRIVGEDEADPAHGSISHVSPLARAMFGKRAGDIVTAGAGEAEIIRIG